MAFHWDPWAAGLAAMLEARGFEAYAVGGCVRDSLLGRQPLDWDLCTSALPEEVLAVFAAFPVVQTGLRHGTVTVVADGRPYEITTFRTDGVYSDSRRPDQVRFVPSLAEDLARRDFTVNAMACAPGGRVVDLFGGRQDLAAGLIRCVGDPAARFGEDALRILRALRFAAVYDFQVEAATGDALVAAAPRLAKVSPQRVGGELVRLLCGPGAGRVVAAFYPVFTCLLPGLAGDGARRAAAVERAVPLPVPRLAALAAGSARPLELLGSLGLDGATTRRAARLAGEGPPHERMPLGRLLMDLGLEGTRDLLGMWGQDMGELEALLATGLCWQVADLAVDGHDLLALGFRGPQVGQTLRLLLGQVVQGQVPNEREPLLEAAGQAGGLKFTK